MYPLDDERRLESLKAILKRDATHVDRAAAALATLEGNGMPPRCLGVTQVSRHLISLEFFVESPAVHCAALTRAVHHDLAVADERVLPPTTIIAVLPVERSARPPADAEACLAELVESAVALAKDDSEASWRQATATAYFVAFHLLSSFANAALPRPLHLLEDMNDALIWQLRRHGSIKARALSEAMSCMFHSYRAATLWLCDGFSQDLATLQVELMKRLRTDLEDFANEVSAARRLSETENARR